MSEFYHKFKHLFQDDSDYFFQKYFQEYAHQPYPPHFAAKPSNVTHTYQ